MLRRPGFGILILAGAFALTGCRNTCGERCRLFHHDPCDQPTARLASAPRSPDCPSCGTVVGSVPAVGTPVSMPGPVYGVPPAGAVPFVPSAPTRPDELPYPSGEPMIPPQNVPLAPNRPADGLGVRPFPQPLIAPTTQPVGMPR